MKIQSKILLMLLTVLVLVIVAVYQNYSYHKEIYNKFVQFTINNAINKIKSDIEKSDRVIDEMLTTRYNLYKQAHQIVLEKLKADPNISLDDLKKEIDKLFPSGRVESHFYFINKNYVIYKTTFAKDLNLDMSNFLGAREYIDNARKQNDKIFIAPPSFDVLNKDYRIYSYASLDKDKSIVLEMGFFDQMASDIKDTLYQFNIENSIIKEVDFFGDYGKYVINFSKHEKIQGITKQEFIKQNIKSTDETLMKVREVSKTHKTLFFDTKEGEKTFRTVYKLINTKKISDNKVKSHILKVKLDVTEFEEKLSQFKKELYLAFFITIISILLMFWSTRKSIVNPLEHILSKVQSWQMIDDKDILNSNNEFSKLAEVFNETFKQQKKLNETLEKRVEIEVNNNLKKEKQLIEQSKMANLGAMIGNIAHQWRQPLGLISTVAVGTKVKIEFDTLDDVKQLSNDMDIIIDKTQYLSESINTFRDFLRENKGTREVILEDRINTALNIVNLSLKDNHIKLINNIDYSKQTKITMPIGELTEVVINIINNAKDAILENEIAEPWVDLTLTSDDSKAIITIEDNAGGIPDEVMPYIFDEYFTTKPDEIGTGLGLYMSYKIITESLNGKLHVENTHNGAKFFIELPQSNS